MRDRRGAYIPGAILILIGLWLLAGNLGLHLPGLDQLWPGLLILLGLGFVAQFFAGERRDEGLVFAGVASTLLGAFFLSVTLGPLEWRDLGRYWPVFVLIGGAAFLAQWLARREERGLLVPAGAALLVGLAGLVLTAGWLNPALTEQLIKLWPLALIAAGLSLMAGYILRRDRDA